MDIQTAGQEILTGHPGPFYVFLGSEYGIKCKYLQSLKKHYGELKEADTVASLLSLFNSRHLVPLKPMLYVVRYDDEFISGLNQELANRLTSAKIIGTLVCIYESDKAATKCGKFLGDWSVEFQPVSPIYIKRYLHSDFPKLPENLLDFAVKCSTSYMNANSICRCLNLVAESAANQPEKSLSKLFAVESEASETQLQAGIASRNFGYLMSILDSFDDNLDSVVYTILNTMIQLDRHLSEPYYDSPLRKYARGWNHEMVYNMFMNTYEVLMQSRSMTSVNMKDLIIYLFALLQYSVIPQVEAMRGGFR
jgi:hypothetical protein